MGIPIVVSDAARGYKFGNIFTTFPSNYPRDFRHKSPITIFLHSCYVGDEDETTKRDDYLRHLRSKCLIARPTKVTVVFSEEEDIDDWWDHVSSILAPTVEDLTIVNYYGEGHIGAPSLPSMRPFLNLTKFALHELGWRETVCTHDFHDVLTARQMTNMKELEFSGIHIDVIKEMVGSNVFTGVEKLTLHDNSGLYNIVIRLMPMFPSLKEFVYELDENDDEPHKIPMELKSIANAIPNLKRFVLECDKSMEDDVIQLMIDYPQYSILEYLVPSPKFQLPEYDEVFDSELS